MPNACTPILVGVTSLVSEILLLSILAKFPFWTHGLQFIVVKKLNGRNSAQNFVISPMTIIICSTYDTFINCRSEAKFRRDLIIMSF